jgi:SNF2 family DNA or RNA helicase
MVSRLGRSWSERHGPAPAVRPGGAQGFLPVIVLHAQRRGLGWLSFLSSLGLGGCLADDMGLGKTPQTLALLLAEREQHATRSRKRPGPTLLICRMSVVGNWQREAERSAPSLRALVHHGSERLAGRKFAIAERRADLVITTYALATRDREALAGVKWERVALDEAQNIKTSDAKQTRAIRSLPARHRIALTGTPVENRLTELHSIMDFLNPGLLGPAAAFKRRYATPIERWRDQRATERLRQATGPFILRRLKVDKEVISDLPDKIEMRVDCNLTREQATLYQAVVDEMLEKAERAEGIERSGIILAALMKLKQACNHPAHLLKDRSELAGRSGKLTRLEEILAEALARCRAGEGAGVALHALPGADPRQGADRAAMAAGREGDGGTSAAAREATRRRDAARHRGCVRGLQADAVPAFERRAEGKLHVPGLGEAVQARRGRLLHPRRALRRGPVPDLRLARP